MVKIIISVLLFCGLQSSCQIAMWHSHNQTSGVNYLLDNYSGVAAAYSLRKLSLSYTGPCIRVQRAFSGAELDIGFLPNGDLDTSAIILFAQQAATDAYVKTIYDQSGNSHHASLYNNATSAITILNNKTGGRVSIRTSASMPIPNNISYSSVFSVLKMNYINIVNYFLSKEAPALNGLVLGGSVVPGSAGVDGAGGTNNVNFGNDTSRHLQYFNMQSSSLFIGRDGIAPTNTGVFASSISAAELFGRSCCNLYLAGQFQEIIMFSSEQSANKALIEANINNYWKVY